MKSPRRFKATRREALAGWTEAIAQDPNNVEAHHNRGVFTSVKKIMLLRFRILAE